MAIKRKCFTHAVLEGISKILGNTNSGLTGSEIQHLLAQSNMDDVSPSLTKWKRLFDAFATYQNKNECSNNILNFIALALAPAKFVDNPEIFSYKQNLINQQLSFIGYQFNNNGKFCEITVTIRCAPSFPHYSFGVLLFPNYNYVELPRIYRYLCALPFQWSYHS